MATSQTKTVLVAEALRSFTTVHQIDDAIHLEAHRCADIARPAAHHLDVEMHAILKLGQSTARKDSICLLADFDNPSWVNAYEDQQTKNNEEVVN